MPHCGFLPTHKGDIVINHCSLKNSPEHHYFMSHGHFSVRQLLIDWASGGMKVFSRDLQMLIDLQFQHSVKVVVDNTRLA